MRPGRPRSLNAARRRERRAASLPCRVTVRFRRAKPAFVRRRRSASARSRIRTRKWRGTARLRRVRKNRAILPRGVAREGRVARLRRLFRAFLELRANDASRGNGVDADAVPCELGCERPRHLDDRGAAMEKGIISGRERSRAIEQRLTTVPAMPSRRRRQPAVSCALPPASSGGGSRRRCD